MEREQTPENATLNATKPLNVKLGDFTNQAKNLMNGEAMHEVESFASDAMKRVSDLSSRTVSFVRKNPVIAVAAVVGIGFVVAKLLNKSKSSSLVSNLESKAKEVGNSLTH